MILPPLVFPGIIIVFSSTKRWRDFKINFYKLKQTVYIGSYHLEFAGVLVDYHCQIEQAGSVISNGREPKSYPGQVFNFKLDGFTP